MNRDDIIQMALEAGLAYDFDDYPDIWQTYMNVGREEIERFAHLVAAQEREQCAIAAEKQARWIGYNAHAEAIAAAIRQRGNQ